MVFKRGRALRWCTAVLCAASALRTSCGQQGVIETVAGGGVGDRGVATATAMSSSSGVAFIINPSSGGVLLYIADRGNNRIRHVDEDGNMTTVAGNGTAGFSGDGDVATAAMIRSPYSVSAVYNTSSSGVVLYIADMNNNRIRRVDEAGSMATVAGNGISGFSGDGGSATAAMLKSPRRVAAVFNAITGGVVLYIVDINNYRIRRVDEGGNITTVAGDGTQGFSGDGGPATAAKINLPYGVAAVFNPSTGGVVLYIADTSNNRIRRVDEDGDITSVAGNGTQGFGGDGGAATASLLYSPSSVSAVYNASSGGVVLYIADTENHRIRRVDEGGNITSVAGDGTQGFSGDGGPATAAKLYIPDDVVVVYNASSGGVVLYIADSSNHCVRRVDEDGNMATVAGTGSTTFGGDDDAATAALLNTPNGVAAVFNPSSGGEVLYIADTTNNRIRRVDEDGNMATVVGNNTYGFGGDGSAATAAMVRNPRGVAAALNTITGNVVLYIADSSNNRVRRVIVAALPSPSVSPTATSSASMTPSSSATASNSASTSGTPTLSATASNSATASGTPSVSVSASITASSSGTATGTPTPSASASSSGTETGTPTSSATASNTPSVSSTLTSSATASPSGTASGTPTSSATVSNSASASVSASPAATSSTSASPSSSAGGNADLTNTGSSSRKLSATFVPYLLGAIAIFLFVALAVVVARKRSRRDEAAYVQAVPAASPAATQVSMV